MGAFCAEELDLRRLVILRGVDFDVVGLVFFDFLSLWMRTRRKVTDHEICVPGLSGRYAVIKH